MERIRFWRVAGETVRLATANAGIIFLYYAINLFLALAERLLETQDQGFTVVGVTSFLVETLADIGVTISVVYFIVSACQGKRSFFPPRPLRVCGNIILATIALCFICLLAGFFGGIPHFIVNISSLPSDPQRWVLRDTLGIITYLLSIFVALFPLLRLGFILPAIVMGDADDYRRSWCLTRGYTLRLYLTVCLSLLPPFLLDLTWRIVSPATVDSMSFDLANTVIVNTCVFALSCFLCVLYAVLVRRERAMKELEQERPEGDLNLEQGAAQ